MRQAIEENYILDVLKNYTSYKVAYNLAQKIAKPDYEVHAAIRTGCFLNYLYTLRDKVRENERVMDQITSNSPEQALLGDFAESPERDELRPKLRSNGPAAAKRDPLSTGGRYRGKVVCDNSLPHRRGRSQNYEAFPQEVADLTLHRVGAFDPQEPFLWFGRRGQGSDNRARKLQDLISIVSLKNFVLVCDSEGIPPSCEVVSPR